MSSIVMLSFLWAMVIMPVTVIMAIVMAAMMMPLRPTFMVAIIMVAVTTPTIPGSSLHHDAVRK